MAELSENERRGYESQFDDLMGGMGSGDVATNGHQEYYTDHRHEEEEEDEEQQVVTSQATFTMETSRPYSPPSSPEKTTKPKGPVLEFPKSGPLRPPTNLIIPPPDPQMSKVQSGDVITTSEGGSYDGGSGVAISPSRLEDTLPTFQQPKRYVKPEEKRESKAAPGVIIMADDKSHPPQQQKTQTVEVAARASDPAPEYDVKPSQPFGSLLAKFNVDGGSTKRAPSASQKAKKSSKFAQGAGDNRCALCDKRVYEMEKMIADKAIYHKMCFKCSHCKRILSLGNFASMEGKLYCKPHFIEMFKTKGNYDEGFGKEKHSKQWQKDPSPDQPPAGDKVDDGIDSVQSLGSIKSRFQSKDDKPPMPRSSVSPSSNGPRHVNGDRTPPEVVNRSESTEEILGRELPPVNMARSMASKFREMESPGDGENYRKPVRKITPPREDVERGVSAYHQDQESQREGVVRSDESAEKEDERPPPSFTKNMLAKFKEMEDTHQAPPSPARSATSPTKRTHRPVGGTYMKASPDEGIADTEPSVNGHGQAATSTEVIREADKNETEELPERGFTKSLLSQWRQIEQTAGPSKTSLAPRVPGSTPTGSRPGSGSGRRQVAASMSDSQDGDENREVVRETDTNEDENLPPPSYTKNMLAKFQTMQQEAQKDPATTPTKKQFKWTVKEAELLRNAKTGKEELQLQQSVNGHQEEEGVSEDNDNAFSSEEEELDYDDSYDIDLECDSQGNPLYPIDHPKHPDNVRRRKQTRQRARAARAGVVRADEPTEAADLPAPNTTKNLLSRFKSMEDVGAPVPTPEKASQLQRSTRISVSSRSTRATSSSSMESREQPDGVETTQDDNTDFNGYDNANHQQANSVVRESDVDMTAELPEQGTTRNLLAKFQSLQAV